MSIVVVRHGPPVAEAGVPASEWRLAEQGSISALADVLPAGPIVSSDERKAVETAKAIGRDYVVDPRLREVRRPFTPDPAEFRALVERYLAGERVAGWEPQGEAVDRFRQAACGIAVSHGTVLSLFAAEVCDVDPVEFWRDLRMPDAWSLDQLGAVRLLDPDRRVDVRTATDGPT